MGHAASQSMSAGALRRFDAERARSAVPSVPVDVGAARRDSAYTGASAAWGRNPSAYADARDRVMPAWRQASPGAVYIIHDIEPYYGVYDAMFLARMFLDAYSNAAYANWLYSHQADPWYQQAHDDVVRQAQQNEDLRAQLAQSDARIAQLQTDSAPVMSADTLPEGVDAAVAIAPEVVQSDADHAAEDEVWRAAQTTSWSLQTKLLISFFLLGAVGWLIVTKFRN
jgi:hypothetical protein